MVFNIQYMLNGLAQMIIAVLGLITLFYSINKKRCKIGHFIGAIGILYLVFSLLNFLWAFSMLEASFNDYIIISSLFSSATAVLFLLVAYTLTKNRNFMYLLAVFLITLAGSYFIFHNFLSINLVSMLLLLILFLDLEFFHHSYLKKIGIAGIAYSMLSLLFIALLFMGFDLRLSAVPDIMMIYIFYNFMQHTISCEKRIRHDIKKVPFPLQLAKFSIFIVALIVFVILGTISVHEIGHALTARMYGCSYSAVVYQSDYLPHTDIGCVGKHNQQMILLGASAMTLFLALIFFFTGNELVRSMSYLIVAFGTIIANTDLIVLGLSKSIIFVLDFLAIILILFAISSITMSYLDECKKVRTAFCHGECP